MGDAVLQEASQSDGDVKKMANELFNKLQFNEEFVGKAENKRDHAKESLEAIVLQLKNTLSHAEQFMHDTALDTQTRSVPPPRFKLGGLEDIEDKIDANPKLSEWVYTEAAWDKAAIKCSPTYNTEGLQARLQKQRMHR